ncbi:hypothetical protein [Rhodococcus sp. IEGM 1330]|uniref:hypothetical protein n=1 Tax=Rhodococcus sp. IEGM 1330 TaxID=3082225 RepID=UPI002955879B|nr:hypothetical protein [Rhodococcus sp. IEGM 1330]MDV8022011.1 hypothetical protein [Rhodococcus sp. IEGM 1330]
MSWSIRSRTNPERWLESTGGIDFTADPITTAALGDISTVMVSDWPGGPRRAGIDTPVRLGTAAWELIPDPEARGDYPTMKRWPHSPFLAY